MIKKNLTFLCMLLLSVVLYAQTGNVGINTSTPDAVLEVYSTTKGVLVPRLTTAQRDAMVSPLNPANKVQEGTVIYNLTEHCLQYNIAPTGTTPTWIGYGCGGSVIPGSVLVLDCANATYNGSLSQNVAASGVSVVIPYTGGNGGPHLGQVANSYNVVGLTATLAAGNFNNGPGTLTYNITGTPTTDGVAFFNINIGGQNCMIYVTVNAGSVFTLDCAGATNSGTLVDGAAASSVSSVIPYTGGNGGAHNGQTVASTGVTGLTATLAAGSFNNGSGTLTYDITGTPSGSGTASFDINIGGKTCTLTRTVSAAAITTLDCAGATNTGNLVSGSSTSGASSVISYTGGNGGAYASQSINSTGVSGLTATLAAGNFANGAGTLTYTITGTPSAAGTASFAISIGGQSCTLTRTVTGGSTAAAFNCAATTINATTYKKDIAYSGTATLNYTGGDGVAYPAGSVASTDVTGFTATWSAGTFANGSGAITITITGTATTYGIASFPITIAGKSCTIKLGACGAPTNTGGFLYFMCHNLGADQTADPFTPSWKLNGAYVQWGKRGPTTNWQTTANSGSLGFAAAPTGATAATANDAAISGWSQILAPNSSWNLSETSPIKTVNDPCPSGYRLPTRNEWQSVVATTPINVSANWTNVGVFTTSNLSPTSYSSGRAIPNKLYLPAAGFRDNSNGSLSNRGNTGQYWASTYLSAPGTNPSGHILYFGNGWHMVTSFWKGMGSSVRCIAE